MAPVENNFPPRGPKIVLGRRLLAELHDAGRAASSAATAVAAARFRAKLAGDPSPAGEATARVLGGYRRTTADRGRGQARPFSAADLAAIGHSASCARKARRCSRRESARAGP